MSIITLTGSLGSGKSTVGALLAEKLNYEYINGSKIFREVSEKLNMSIVEINNKAEEINLDEKTDAFLKDLNTRDNLIVDSRLAWYFINKSFDVFLYVDLDIAVNRISKSDRTTEGDINNLITLKDSLVVRRKLEIDRFKRLYNVDIEDSNNYDLVINTSNLTPIQIVETIIIKGGIKI